MEQNHPLLSYFYEISAIPRPSYKEQNIAAPFLTVNFSLRRMHEKITIIIGHR